MYLVYWYVANQDHLVLYFKIIKYVFLFSSLRLDYVVTFMCVLYSVCVNACQCPSPHTPRATPAPLLRCAAAAALQSSKCLGLLSPPRRRVPGRLQLGLSAVKSSLLQYQNSQWRGSSDWMSLPSHQAPLPAKPLVAHSHVSACLCNPLHI